MLKIFQSTSKGPILLLPNLQTIKATGTGSLPLPFSSQATKTSIFDKKDLQNASLISLGQLCDDDYTVFLDKQKIVVNKNKKIILHGRRNSSDGLWDIHFPTEKFKKYITTKALKENKNQLNVIIHKDKTNQELAAYLHACAFSPLKQTFISLPQK